MSVFQLHSNSDKGDGSVKYILTGEGAGTIFIIDDTTGDIHSTKSLDREQKTHYVLHAQAIDRRTNKPLEPESEFIIKVQDINDNAPKFTDGPYIVTVPEMSDMGKEVIFIMEKLMYVIDNIKDYFLKNFLKTYMCIFVEIRETSKVLGYFYCIKTY